MPVGTLLGLFAGGKKPSVPGYTPVDPGRVQQDTLGYNLAALPGETELARKTNRANQADILELIRSGVPGYDAITGKTSDAIQSYLSGNLPEDVGKSVVRSAAGRALMGGYQGSGMFRNLGLRDLGRTSDDAIRYGIGAGQQFTGNQAALTMPNRYEVGSGYYNPNTMLQFKGQEAQNMWNRDWLASQVKAQPAPWAKFLTDRLVGLEDAAIGVGANVLGQKYGAKYK